jgi:hypothetical protein
MTAHVHIKREPGIFTCTCHKHGFIESDVVLCEAQENKQICYHVIAALVHASREQKCKIYFKYFENEARGLAGKNGNERAKIIKIVAGKAECYAVVFPPKFTLSTKKPVDKMYLIDADAKRFHRLTCPKCAGLMSGDKCIGHADSDQGGCGFVR